VFQLAPFAYGGLSYPTHESIVRELAQGGGASWTLRPHPGDAAIDRARSIVATSFVLSEGEVLCMVDHDVSWRTGDLTLIAEIAQRERAMVAGMVSKRAIGLGFGGRFADGKPHEFGTDELVELPEGGYAGGAFVAIHRDVLLKVAEHHQLPMVRGNFLPFFLPEVVFNDAKGVHEYLSEDYAFCRRVRAAGCRVLVSMKPLVIHHGPFGFSVIDHGAVAA